LNESKKFLKEDFEYEEKVTISYWCCYAGCRSGNHCFCSRPNQARC